MVAQLRRDIADGFVGSGRRFSVAKTASRSPPEATAWGGREAGFRLDATQDPAGIWIKRSRETLAAGSLAMDRKELREIADGFNEEFMRTVSALARGEGFLAVIRHRTVAHMAGGRGANDPSTVQRANGLPPVTGTMELPFDALETGDAARLIDTLRGAASEMKSEITRRAFARMDEIAEENGMVVDARGRPFSADLFVEVIEKMDIDFDDSGNAIMPSFVVHPSNMERMRAALETDEANEKIAAVIAKKKKAKGL